MYRKILVPLDTSYRAEAILDHVLELAAVMDSEVLFLHVLEPRTSAATPYEMFPYYEEQDDERRYQDADTYLSGVVRRFEERGVKARKSVVTGAIVRAIQDIAKQEEIDLIAMASHGRSGLARVFYGSVAAGVLHGADRPLLIVRARGSQAHP